MIELFTGLPGSGKTLSVVQRVVEARQAGRPVYSAGLEWTAEAASLGVIDLPDPLTWQDCPDGSLIVIDEVQKWMPTRAQRDPIPPVMALSEHRHRGFDFLMMTQSPAMLDVWVRRLVGRHVHVLRKFGTHNCERIIWGECVDDPQSLTMRQRGQTEIWRYPAPLFKLYKSATLHTHKSRLPWQMIALPLVLVLASFGIYFAKGYLQGLEAEAATIEPETTAAAEGPAQPRPPSLPSRARAESEIAPMTAEQYLAAITPRVDGMPWSAPIFDGAKPAELPRVACLLTAKTCRCYTEQATRIKVGHDRCATIARFGVYRPQFGRGQST